MTRKRKGKVGLFGLLVLFAIILLLSIRFILPYSDKAKQATVTASELSPEALVEASVKCTVQCQGCRGSGCGERTCTFIRKETINGQEIEIPTENIACSAIYSLEIPTERIL